MQLDVNWLLLSLLVSGVGSILFLYGKKESRLPHMLVGGIFVIYPYFVANSLLMSIIAIFLSVLLWVVTRLGW